MPDLSQNYINQIQQAIKLGNLEDAEFSFNQAQRCLFPFHPEERNLVVHNGGNILLEGYLNKKNYLKACYMWDKQCEILVQNNILREEIFYENGNKICNLMNADNALSHSAYQKMQILERQLKR